MKRPEREAKRSQPSRFKNMYTFTTISTYVIMWCLNTGMTVGILVANSAQFDSTAGRARSIENENK
jgi:hypothetical protein